MPSFRLPLLVVVLAAVLAGRAAFLVGSAKPDASADGLLTPRLQRVDDLLHDAVARQEIAGGVVLLARHGRLDHVQAIGWRDAEAGIPMTVDTLFRLASMTKPITSVAAMMLVEDGKLHLDDPVSKYLPEFKETKPLLAWSLGAAREITIHDLLTHTSGLTYRFWGRQPLSALYRAYGVCDGLMYPGGRGVDNVRRLAKLPLLFPPGSAWEYGLSTDVLGVVIETVSGQDLDAFFHERIFRPLKMDDTFFVVPQAKRERLAPLYQRGVDGKRRRIGDEAVTLGELTFAAGYPCVNDSKYFSGGAGLVSTAGDYARFLQMLLDGGVGDGIRLLQKKTVQRMTSNQIGAGNNYLQEHGDGYGYGFGVRTHACSTWDAASTGTYAWSGIFNTYFWVDPKKELIGVLMTQVFTASDKSLRSEFKKRAYACLAD